MYLSIAVPTVNCRSTFLKKKVFQLQLYSYHRYSSSSAPTVPVATAVESRIRDLQQWRAPNFGWHVLSMKVKKRQGAGGGGPKLVTKLGPKPSKKSSTGFGVPVAVGAFAAVAIVALLTGGGGSDDGDTDRMNPKINSVAPYSVRARPRNSSSAFARTDLPRQKSDRINHALPACQSIVWQGSDTRRRQKTRRGAGSAEGHGWHRCR